MNTLDSYPWTMQISRMTPRLGAEIRGIDLVALDAAGFAELEAAFNEFGVIVVRDQHFTPASLAEFVGRFGPLETHTLLQYTLADNPHVYVLSNIIEDGRPIGAHNEGIGWHSDLSYKQFPVMATALYGIICPPEGADTLLADMEAAYEDLPAARRAELDRLTVHHSYQRWMARRADRAPLTEAQKAQTPDVFHPLVRTHPRTGRKSLYIGTDSVHGLKEIDNPAGKRIVLDLVEYATAERFVLRHRWRAGDFLMWDNRRTLHTGTLYDDTRYQRLIHRLMVKGDKPF